MKSQGNHKGGLILIAFGVLVTVFASVVTIVLFQVSKEMRSPSMPFYLFPLIGGGVAALVLFGAGLSSLIKWNASRRIMLNGRKTECKVHNILYLRNGGYRLIVTFRGDSGNEFKHWLYIGYNDAALLKPDMVLECYVQGDDCYIDESRIVIKEQADI